MTEPALEIHRLDGGASLHIPNGFDVAREFFTKDASSLGPRSYDAVAGRTRVHAITVDDIDAMYRTMRMRSRRDAWDALIAEPGPLPWLRALDRGWELMDAPDDLWQQRLAPRMDTAFAAMIGPHRQVTGVSKVLHLKRPKLVPAHRSWLPAG